MNSIGGIVAELSLRTDAWVKGFKEAQDVAKEAGKAIEKAIGEGPAKYQETFANLSVQMSDSLRTAADSVGELNQAFEELDGPVQQFSQTASQEFETTSTSINTILESVRELNQILDQLTVGDISQQFENITTSATTAGEAIRNMVEPLQEVIASITNMGSTMQQVLGQLGAITAPLEGFKDIPQAATALEQISSTLETLKGIAGTAGSKISQELKAGIKTPSKQAAQAVQSIVDAVVQVKDSFAKNAPMAQTAVENHIREAFTRTSGEISKTHGKFRAFVSSITGMGDVGDTLSANLVGIPAKIQTAFEPAIRAIERFTTEIRTIGDELAQAFTIPIIEAGNATELFANSLERLGTSFTTLSSAIATDSQTMETGLDGFAITMDEVQMTMERVAKESEQAFGQIVNRINELNEAVERMAPGLETTMRNIGQVLTEFSQHIEQAVQGIQQLLGVEAAPTQLITALNEVLDLISRIAVEAEKAAVALGKVMKTAPKEMKDTAKKAKGSVEKVGKQVKKTAKESGQAMTKATGDMKKGFTDTGKEAQRVTWAIRGYLKDTARVVTGILIARTFYMLLKRIEQTIGAAYELKQAFEETAMSFKYLLNTTERVAANMAHQMRYWALDTKESIASVTRGFQDLYIAGVATQDIEPVMQILIGTSTAYGVSLNDLIGTMKRVAATPVVTSSTMRVLERMGIEVLPMIREQLGLTADDLTSLGELAIPGQVMFKALVRGMAEYADAATEGAQTVRARWADLMEVMQDSISLLTGDMFEAWSDTLGRMLDWMARFREGLIRLGPRMFIHLFPIGVQKDLRMLISSVRALWDAFVRLGRIVRAIVGDALILLVRVLAYVLPLIASFAQWIANAAVSAWNAYPAIRLITRAITALIVAHVVAAAIKGLVLWILRLRIVVAVKKAVIALGFAFAFVAKNAFLLAAILAILLGNFGAVMGAIDGVRNALAKAFPSFAKPEGPDHLLDDWLGTPGDFPEFEALPEDMEDIGEGAGKAEDDLEDLKDKVEEVEDAFKPFLAAFDEVYQVPEQDLDTGLDDLGDLDDLIDDLGKGAGDFEWPDLEMPDITIPTDLWDYRDLLASIGQDFDLGLQGVMDALERFSKYFEGWKGWLMAALLLFGHFLYKTFIWPLIQNAIAWIGRGLRLIGGYIKYFLKWRLGQIILGALASLWAGIKAKLVLIGLNIIKWFWNTYAAIKAWFLSLKVVKWFKAAFSWAAIKGVFTNLWAGIKGWFGSLTIVKWLKGVFASSKILKVIGGAFKGSKIIAILKGVLTAVATALGGWLPLLIAGILAGLAYVWYEWGDEIGEWFSDIWGGIVDWFQDSVVEPLGEAWEGVIEWFEDVGERFSSWWEDLPKNIRKWLNKAKERIVKFFLDDLPYAIFYALGRIVSWRMEVERAFREWVANTARAIAEWVVETWGRIVQWRIDTEEAFREWVSSTVAGFIEWARQVPGRIRDWAVETYGIISEWASDTWEALIEWLEDLPETFAEWFSETVDKIKEWIPKAIEAAKDLGQGIYDGIVEFIQDLPSRVGDILKGIVGGIVGWIRGIWDAANRIGEAADKGWHDGLQARSPTRIERTMDQVVAHCKNSVESLKTVFDGLVRPLSRTWNTISNEADTSWTGMFNSILEGARQVIRELEQGFRSLQRSLRSIWTGIANYIVNIWTTMVNRVIREAQRLISTLNRMGVAGGSIRITGTATGGTLTGLAQGGVVRRDMLARIGEGGKKEAVLPLDRRSLQPFAEILAEQIGHRAPAEEHLPPMYVGTLVASDQSLKELERRLKVIRKQEVWRGAR